MAWNIITSSKSAGISSGLSYSADEPLAPGQIVRVPLRNQVIEGVVFGESDQKITDLKSITEVLSAYPLLSSAQLQTIQWLAKYYCCSLRQGLQVWLPGKPWSSLLPTKCECYSLVQAAEVRGKQQQAVMEYLETHGETRWDALREELGVTKSTMQTLVQKGYITSTFTVQQWEQVPLTISRPTLSEQQQEAYEKITAATTPSLLFGVTGSGKTEVYAQLIADCLEQGKQAILLVPEILLTEQIIERFKKLVNPEAIAVIHSTLTPANRREEWKRIRSGQVRLVIGSRSALFSPLHELGLVVIDEEHEWTYKNEQTPRYHARETAEQLCRQSGAKLVVGSATPAIETWHKATTGSYTLATLASRFGSGTLPTVKVVDLGHVNFGKHYPFSNTLIEAIAERLQRKEQSVLFLNRRGLASSLLCMDCRRRVVSPESQLPYTVHETSDNRLELRDHTFGGAVQAPSSCPHCQSVNLRPVGAGTQRIEAIVKTLFPEAKVARADSDTLTHPTQMKELLLGLQEGSIDILLGTQSVVKGLDLPRVTLAAVLIADLGLSLPHFRAGERTFQMLTQLTGRSGRAKPGEVIIQTFRPDTPEIKFATFHQTEQFLQTELQLRTAAKYPPLSQMIRFICRGPEAPARAKELALQLQQVAQGHQVGCAPTLFGGGREWHVLLRGEHPKQYLSRIDLHGVVVDVDPLDIV